MPVSLQLLGQFPLLRPIPQDTLAVLSQQMTLQSFARRAMVLSKDKPTLELGFLVDGRLQGVDFTVDGRSVGLYFVEPGDYFGELSVVDGKAPSEFVVAANKSTVAFLEARAARELILGHPELARAVMERLAHRVRAVTAQRTLLGLPNPFQRLSVLLLQLSQDRPGTGPEVDQVPTHQELAIMINASRETVTRAFQVLFLHKVLVREGNTLRLVQPAMLRDIAEGRTEPPKA
ncbi:Crp/Fnr family transcriptional regulator [uncultured Xylophilus sp.]|uniref:Crp/Fnr family transcriptional regulator n=1 Tax=uncultured Xylophilus sp. TaxID=296832 RepID=UPI0025FBB562|nr:Crp/Fnr family transcriptional regulator [uncultured Xylophilus sp.]